MARMSRMTWLCSLPVSSAISRLDMVSTAPGSTMGSTISRFATGLAEEGIFVLSGFLGWPTRYDKIVRRRVQNSVLSLPISRTKVPHFPYYRSLGLLGNLFQNKGLAHFSVSSLRIFKILYGASQPSCCAARLLRCFALPGLAVQGRAMCLGSLLRRCYAVSWALRLWWYQLSRIAAKRWKPIAKSSLREQQFLERPNLAGRKNKGGLMRG